MQNTDNQQKNKECLEIHKRFEMIRQWMNRDEVDNYFQRDNRPGILLSMILDRYCKNREFIALLKTEVSEELAEQLSHIDESIQVSHFFYQTALVDLHKIHNRYIKKINRLLNNIHNNYKK